jgi:thiol-disulfide isomerase/thioredoxin
MTPRALAGLLVSLILAVFCLVPGGRAQVPPYSARFLDSNEILELEALRGRVVLLNFWATWCLPCRHEIPVLAALSQKHRDQGLEVLGVSLDVAGAEDRVRRLVAEQGMPYTVLLDQESLASDIFALAGLPATFLISREGALLWQRMGPVLESDPELEEAIAQALGWDEDGDGEEDERGDASASISSGNR